MLEITSPLTVSPAVWNYVRERDLESIMDELAEMTSELFDDANGIAAELHEDPDVDGLRWISFHVEVSWNDAERVRQARDEWYDRTATAYPPTVLAEFGLEIDRRPE